MDLVALDAIDVHVHVEQDRHGCFALDQELLDASARYFHASQDRTPTVEEIAEYYRARRMAVEDLLRAEVPEFRAGPGLHSQQGVVAAPAAQHCPGSARICGRSPILRG